jgi:hypothetical protein
MLARLVFAVCCLLAIITFADWYAAPSVPCEAPLRHSGNGGKANQGSKEYCSAGKMVAAWRYLGGLVDDWHDDLTAAATLVIAVFTTILGIFTVQLSAATKNAAAAAKLSAEHIPMTCSP